MSTDGQPAGELPEPKGKQREIVALRADGHAVVLGTAGSGKTTMAIHRAANLADPLTSHAGKVLLCTFNRSLLAYLKHYRPPMLGDVVIENYHTFARGYLGYRGVLGRSSICSSEERLSYVSSAVANLLEDADPDAAAVLARPDRFFADEIRFIDQYGFGLDGYIGTDRFGRGAGFPRESRPVVWQVRDEYHLLREEDGYQYDWEDIGTAVRKQLEQDGTTRMYTHVVIDEGQNFSPEMLRSLAAAIPPDGSLTFFGDMAQQLYGRQVSWRQAGLQVRDAVIRFDRNYRNTPEIAALGLAIAAMPYFRDVPDMVEPDEFEPSGPKPSLVAFANRQEEAQFVIERAQEAARTGSVGVLMRRHADETFFHRAFRGAHHLSRNMNVWNPGPGVSYGTVHAAQGYEFDQVFIFGLSDRAWPDPTALAHEDEEIATAQDGQLLYVAVTRAKRELVMTYVGAPTSLLPPNTDLWLDQRA